MAWRKLALGGEARMDRRFMALASIIACTMAKNDAESIHSLFVSRLDKPVRDLLRPARRNPRGGFESLGRSAR